MIRRSGKFLVLGAAMSLCVTALTPAARAEDFFSALFGAFGGRHHMPSMPLPFASEGDANATTEARPHFAGGQAYCVRGCDGRYFPIAGPSNESKAASCNSFCPAGDAKLVYGGNIDSAVTETGKPYSELPNAFRYRKEVVAGCTCNGKDSFGLAQVKIEDDPTLRKGDVVASANGLVVTGKTDQRGAALNFSPAPRQVSARYQRAPVIASE